MSVAIVSARSAGQVVLHLNPNQPVPILPYELHEHVTADAWATRIPQLIRVGSRYNKPLLEGIWLTLMFICALAIPIGLNDTIYQGLERNIGEDTFSAIYQARWISTAILLGIVLVFLIPLGIWKSAGQARLTKLIKQWEDEDARSRAPGTFKPIWKAKLPAALSPRTRLTVTTPYLQAQSYFHPAAYMPSWINGPVNPGSDDGFHAANQGFQKPTMYGELPLYGTHVRNSRGTLQPHGDHSVYSDEKKGLEHVDI
ncbi:hypothetical protein EDB92DRAFT_1873397 [Lactarius akahatsu]|uniref:Uncharacterized protein n=1 Tax=Lactarius akahatsu TaxID=416441 RepID=A0AAD4QBU5_9AGAM|nr:hypothetical protein EDB92DRAFT_1873397 [Lactarius akahatsu]